MFWLYFQSIKQRKAARPYLRAQVNLLSIRTGWRQKLQTAASLHTFVAAHPENKVFHLIFFYFISTSSTLREISFFYYYFFFYPDLPGVAKQQPISSSAPMIHSSNAAPGFNKLESPDDSEQCAAEYRVRMWIIYTHEFPRRAHCHIHLMCARRAHAFSYGPAPLPHFCVTCYSLMNKSIHNGGFMDSVQSIEWFNSSECRGAT